MSTPEGDCDDFSMLSCAMLETVGVKSSLVTVAGDTKYPQQFTHIYALANGIPFDSSHGREVGWEIPTTRKQVWPVWIQNKGEKMITINRGLGDDGSDSIWFGDTLPVDSTGYSQVYAPSISYPSVSSPSSGSSWENMLASLIPGIAQAGEKIAVQATQQPGVQTSSVNPRTGQMTTSSVVLPAGTSATGLNLSNFQLPGMTSGGSIMPVVLIGGAILAFFVLSRNR
jgi:hypothetical protein